MADEHSDRSAQAQDEHLVKAALSVFIGLVFTTLIMYGCGASGLIIRDGSGRVILGLSFRVEANSTPGVQETTDVP